MTTLRRLLLSLLLPLACLAAPVPSAASASAASFTNDVDNISTIGLGVIHVQDGNYVYGKYDAVLPAYQGTYGYFGWTTTAGWYTGPGYCTRQYRADTPTSPYRRQLPDLGPGQHFIGSNTAYNVQPYKGTC